MTYEAVYTGLHCHDNGYAGSEDGDEEDDDDDDDDDADDNDDDDARDDDGDPGLVQCRRLGPSAAVREVGILGFWAMPSKLGVSRNLCKSASQQERRY